jgi:hypothetical protein
MVYVLTNNICRAPAPRKSTRFNPARAAKFPDGAVPHAQKALRRASGVYSLGGAGLFPE